MARGHLKRLCEGFRESAVRHRVEIVAPLTIGPQLSPRPTFFRPAQAFDLGSSSRDRRDLTIITKTRGRYSLQRVATTLLAAATTAIWLSAAAFAAQNSDTIAVEGNRRIDADTVRTYFHSSL